jgi:hypothetical protein
VFSGLTNQVGEAMPTNRDVARFLRGIWRPVLLPGFIVAIGYGGYQYQAEGLAYLKEFFLGPGRVTRVSLLAWCIINWKSLPLVWTVGLSLDPTIRGK